MWLDSANIPSVFAVYTSLSAMVPPTSDRSLPAIPGILQEVTFALTAEVFKLGNLRVCSSAPDSGPYGSSHSSRHTIGVVVNALRISQASQRAYRPSVFNVVASGVVETVSLSSWGESVTSVPSPTSGAMCPSLVEGSFADFLVLLSSSAAGVFTLSVFFSPGLCLNMPRRFCVWLPFGVPGDFIGVIGGGAIGLWVYVGASFAS